MPIGGSSPAKTFTRAYNIYSGADCVQQADAAGRTIQSVDQDGEGNDQAAAINAMLMLDGGNWAADIPTNGNKFTGVGNAAARDQFASAAQVQDGNFTFVSAAGTGDAITLDLTPSITAYAAGQRFSFKATATNTGAATVNVDAVGAKSIKKGADGSTALAAGDITSGGIYHIAYDGTNFQLLNPKFPAGFATTDSPQFTGIELGNASDTTLTRASAGDIAVEGNIVYRDGGTTVPVDDGGSGRETATAYAVICGGTTATGAHQSIASVGTAGQRLTSNGVGALPSMQDQVIAAGTEQSTASGTAFDFTSIPATAKRITVIFSQVSLSGSDDILVQIGDSGGIENTGYDATGDIATVSTNSSAGFLLKVNQSGRTVAGIMTLVRLGTGDTWIGSYAVKVSGSATGHGGGAKALSATLDRVRITRTGTDSFDGGAVNILYE